VHLNLDKVEVTTSKGFIAEWTTGVLYKEYDSELSGRGYSKGECWRAHIEDEWFVDAFNRDLEGVTNIEREACKLKAAQYNKERNDKTAAVCSVNKISGIEIIANKGYEICLYKR
jgi:hypothetical protein